MSIKRSYSCNLCRDSYQPEELVGLYWITFPKGWEQRPAHGCENHICKTCLSSLLKISAQEQGESDANGDR